MKPLHFDDAANERIVLRLARRKARGLVLSLGYAEVPPPGADEGGLNLLVGTAFNVPATFEGAQRLSWTGPGICPPETSPPAGPPGAMRLRPAPLPISPDASPFTRP